VLPDPFLFPDNSALPEHSRLLTQCTHTPRMHARTHAHAHKNVCSISCLLRLVPRTTGAVSNACEAVRVSGGETANIVRTAVRRAQSSPRWNEEFQWALLSAPEVCVLLREGTASRLLNVFIRSSHLTNKSARTNIGPMKPFTYLPSYLTLTKNVTGRHVRDIVMGRSGTISRHLHWSGQ